MKGVFSMNITVQPEQERVIERAIRSGAFRSADEFIEAAIASLSSSPEPLAAAPRKSGLWTLRRGLVLGDLSIKDLIEEGRE